jgi:endonuclease/exonuclease/phosphatase family metal-dependent hydrolase
MPRFINTIALICLSISFNANANVHTIGIWNMKWLGTVSGSQLDSVENVPHYASIIIKTEATILALQEIGATHKINDEAKCYYLDLIVLELNEKSHKTWSYKLDLKNRNQRLAFLFQTEQWDVTAKTIWPGKSYRSARRPFVARVKHKMSGFDFDFINIHFKAFPDEKSRTKRANNISELIEWTNTNNLDDETIIGGDTNIYSNEGSIDLPLTTNGFFQANDDEGTAIYKGKISNRFDRFYLSTGFKDEIKRAAKTLRSTDIVDVIKGHNNESVEWYNNNISDHYPVTIKIQPAQ